MRVAALLLAALALPGAQAATQPVTGLLESAGPATLSGANGFRADVDALLYRGTGDASAAGSFWLDAPGATAYHVNVPRMVALGPGGTPGAQPPVDLRAAVLHTAPGVRLGFRHPAGDHAASGH